MKDKKKKKERGFNRAREGETGQERREEVRRERREEMGRKGTCSC